VQRGWMTSRLAPEIARQVFIDPVQIPHHRPSIIILQKTREAEAYLVSRSLVHHQDKLSHMGNGVILVFSAFNHRLTPSRPAPHRKSPENHPVSERTVDDEENNNMRSNAVLCESFPCHDLMESIFPIRQLIKRFTQLPITRHSLHLANSEPMGLLMLDLRQTALMDFQKCRIIQRPLGG
jgi:hypothetical protein